MKLLRPLLLLGSHGAVAALGFAAGIYALPILIAPAPPAAQRLQAAIDGAGWHGQFRRDLTDSDWLHWAEGRLAIGDRQIAFEGSMAPGPDYQIYFSPEFVQTEADFLRLRGQMRHAGPLGQFNGFLLPLPADLDPTDYAAVIIWCESFGQFISAASYAPR